MYCFMTYSWCHTGKIKCTRQIVNLTYLQNIIPEKTFKYCTVSRRCRKVAVILQKVNYMTLVQSKIFLHINTYCWNRVQICDGSVYFFIHGDFIMAWPSLYPQYTSFPDFSGKGVLISSENKEEDEPLEIQIKCQKLKPNT